jgi:hypothetical protein
MEEGDEIWQAVCQQLEGQEFFLVLLECCTNTQLRMLNSLRFSTEEESRNPPKLPDSKPEFSSQKYDQLNRATGKEAKFAETGAVIQSAISKNWEKPCSADALPQDQPVLAVSTRNFLRP